MELATNSLLIKRGKLLMVSWFQKPVTINPRLWEDRGTVVLWIQPGYSMNFRDDFRRATLCLERGYPQMEKLITHKFRLDEIQKAMDVLKAKPADYIKGIVIP
jgi:threonine dehydrogenase-like Zn-dependent dehydrogenase